jgi:hypothetical protein
MTKCTGDHQASQLRWSLLCVRHLPSSPALIEMCIWSSTGQNGAPPLRTRRPRYFVGWLRFRHQLRCVDGCVLGKGRFVVDFLFPIDRRLEFQN